MNSLLEFWLEGSCVLLVGFGCYKLALHRLTFFELNRVYLLLVAGLAMVVPFVSFRWRIEETALYEFSLPSWEVGGASSVSPGIDWLSLLAGIYFLGVGFFFFRSVLSLIILLLRINRCEKIVYQGTKIALHSDFDPASFFGYVLLPNFTPSDLDHQQILTHESIHIKKRHSLDLVVLEMLKILFWFNPVAYFLGKSLREVHEFQADSAVTQTFQSFAYSRLLLRLLASRQQWQLTHNFNQFQTKKRIMMMNKENSTPWAKGRFLLAIPVMALLGLAFACEQSITDETMSPDVDDFAEVIDSDGNKELIGLSNGKVVELTGEEIFDMVEEQPSPSGGMEGWNAYLSENLVYPEQARKEGVEGTVIVVFVINKDGSISDVDILRGVGGGCDEESVRVVEQSPAWEPGRQKGLPVRTRMRLPIRFKLG